MNQKKRTTTRVFISNFFILIIVLITLSCKVKDLNDEYYSQFNSKNENTIKEIFNAQYDSFLKQDMTQFTENSFVHYEINQRVQSTSIIKISDIYTKVDTKTDFSFQDTAGVLYEIKGEQIKYKNGSSKPATGSLYYLYYPTEELPESLKPSINYSIFLYPNQGIRSYNSYKISENILDTKAAKIKAKYYLLKVKPTQIKDIRQPECSTCFLNAKKITYYEKPTNTNQIIFHTIYINLDVPFLWGYFLDKTKTKIIGQSITPFMDGVISHCREAWAQTNSNRNDNHVLLKLCSVARDFQKR